MATENPITVPVELTYEELTRVIIAVEHMRHKEGKALYEAQSPLCYPYENHLNKEMVELFSRRENDAAKLRDKFKEARQTVALIMSDGAGAD